MIICHDNYVLFCIFEKYYHHKPNNEKLQMKKIIYWGEVCKLRVCYSIYKKVSLIMIRIYEYDADQGGHTEHGGDPFPWRRFCTSRLVTREASIILLHRLKTWEISGSLLVLKKNSTWKGSRQNIMPFVRDTPKTWVYTAECA